MSGVPSESFSEWMKLHILGLALNRLHDGSQTHLTNLLFDSNGEIVVFEANKRMSQVAALWLSHCSPWRNVCMNYQLDYSLGFLLPGAF